MKITPLDIRQKRFDTGLRGFSRREVEAYLELLAGEFEEVVKENISLKEEIKRAQLRIEQYQERERTLQETMVTAQKISEDLKAAERLTFDLTAGHVSPALEAYLKDNPNVTLVGVISVVLFLAMEYPPIGALPVAIAMVGRLLEPGLRSALPGEVRAMELRLSEKLGAEFRVRSPDEADARLRRMATLLASAAA